MMSAGQSKGEPKGGTCWLEQSREECKDGTHNGEKKTVPSVKGKTEGEYKDVAYKTLSPESVPAGWEICVLV